MAKEIERKWVVKKMPEVDRRNCLKIDQGYLVWDGHTEVRVRRHGKKHTMTVKKGEGMERDEVEVPVTQAVFDELWPMTDGRRVAKFRHIVREGGRKMEVDVYCGHLLSLHVVEVEFDSVSEAKKYDPPEWFGREVTGDRKYTNRNLSEHGLP